MHFEVWAPQASRVTLQCDSATRALERDPERAGWWSGEAEARDGSRYGFAVDDGPVLPDPRSRRQPDGPDGLSAVVDHGRAHLAHRVGGPRAAGRGPVRAARRHVHARGHAGRGGRAARPPRGTGRHARRVDAAVPVPRAARLGVRGGLAVGRARAVRRPRGAEALCRPGARARSRRGPRRRAQPPGAVGQLSARLRPVLHGHASDALGLGGEPGRARLGRGARVSARQRAGLAARLPDRRAAAGRGARAAATRARATSWRSCRRRWTPSPPTWAGRCP